MRWTCTVVLLGSSLVSPWATPLGSARAGDIVFHGVDNSQLDLTPKPGEIETEAVKQFKATGRNPYLRDSEALVEGRRLYQARCQACHGPDGKGRSAPSLVADEPLYSRVTTDVGLFEIIYGGASGAMQPFARQGLRQDSILKIMAYARTLKRP